MQARLLPEQQFERERTSRDANARACVRARLLEADEAHQAKEHRALLRTQRGAHSAHVVRLVVGLSFSRGADLTPDLFYHLRSETWKVTPLFTRPPSISARRAEAHALTAIVASSASRGSSDGYSNSGAS